jgi:hypothetical protein
MTDSLARHPPARRTADGTFQVLLDDRFDEPLVPGAVVGSRATCGVLRRGVDREGVMAVDHGQLRIGWMAHGGWGRATLAYGPFERLDGIALIVSAMNGLTTSQTDPRPEGGRARLRRWAATFPRVSPRRPVLRDNMMIGWFEDPVPNRAPTPIAAVVHRAGDDATGELWFHVGPRRVLIAGDLQNLPATYAIDVRDGVASLFAWSYPGAHGFASPDDLQPLAQLPLAGPVPAAAHAAIHQAILGEVCYRVDTRVDHVSVVRNDDVEALVADARAGTPPWEPQPGPIEIFDDFTGPEGDLAGSGVGTNRPTWDRALGVGVIERTGAGRARVRGTIAAPNPGRTVYCVPWSDRTGVEVSAVVIPPGTRRGEGHQGRSGLVVWQDSDNHLVVNHFIDDGSVGVSISAFLRMGGEETMFEWDAVWSNVGHRVRWGVPFRLSLACDGSQFLCRVDDEPVLYRAVTDYRATAQPLLISGVGVVANWEWGDDTGTEFEQFAVRPIMRPVVGPQSAPAARGGRRLR